MNTVSPEVIFERLTNPETRATVMAVRDTHPELYRRIQRGVWLADPQDHYRYVAVSEDPDWSEYDPEVIVLCWTDCSLSTIRAVFTHFFHNPPLEDPPLTDEENEEISSHLYRCAQVVFDWLQNGTLPPTPIELARRLGPLPTQTIAICHGVVGWLDTERFIECARDQSLRPEQPLTLQKCYAPLDFLFNAQSVRFEPSTVPFGDAVPPPGALRDLEAVSSRSKLIWLGFAQPSNDSERFSYRSAVGTWLSAHRESPERCSLTVAVNDSVDGTSLTEHQLSAICDAYRVDWESLPGSDTASFECHVLSFSNETKVLEVLRSVAEGTV